MCVLELAEWTEEGLNCVNAGISFGLGVEKRTTLVNPTPTAVTADPPAPEARDLVHAHGRSQGRFRGICVKLALDEVALVPKSDRAQWVATHICRRWNNCLEAQITFMAPKS